VIPDIGCLERKIPWQGALHGEIPGLEVSLAQVERNHEVSIVASIADDPIWRNDGELRRWKARGQRAGRYESIGGVEGVVLEHREIEGVTVIREWDRADAVAGSQDGLLVEAVGRA